MSGRASSGPPLSATDNRLRREGGREVGKGSVCLWEGAPGAPVFHLLLPSFTCQQLSLSQRTWKTKVFSPAGPLSGDNHLLLSVPHRQSGLASTWEVQKQDQQHLHLQHASISDAALACSCDLFSKTH